MKKSRLAFQSLTVLLQETREQALDPSDVLEAVFSRIATSEKIVNSFIQIGSKRKLMALVRKEVENLESSQKRNLLALPIAVKDNTWVKGFKCTCGSKYFENFWPSTDSVMVEQLRKVGAILIGKTNLDELGLGVKGENKTFGRTCNPWDPDLISGGSSGGSAAAVAAGFAVAGTGTDSGGSVRFPAACCGVVGLKPTYGRIDAKGTFEFSKTLGHVGLFARFAEDIPFLLNLAGQRANTSGQFGRVRKETNLLKVAVLELDDLPIQEKIVDSFEKAVDRLRAHSVEIFYIRIPELKESRSIGRTIGLAEFALSHSKSKEYENEKFFGANVVNSYRYGKKISASRYEQALSLRVGITKKIDSLLQEYDLLMTPATPVLPYRELSETLEVGSKEYRAPELVGLFLMLFNLTGHPAMSVPTGFTHGLPCSVQLVARPWSENIIVQAAMLLQDSEIYRRNLPRF